MSSRYPGGLITKTPVVPTTAAAPGVWTMEQALQYIKAGTWPPSLKTVEIKIWGAGGGGGNYGGSSGEFGGPGGFATATFSVAPGTVLTIIVGEGGKQGTADKAAPNGGGGKQTDSGYWSGGGGGLCSVFVGSGITWSNITSASGTLTSKALIAAGSGGGGGYYVTSDGGGWGGGTSGGDGFNRTGGSSGGNGAGGTATSGGSGGIGGDGGANGSFLKGGDGGGSGSGTTGGGGGAGWYGGGGAGNQNSGGGGGGGSGMIASITSGTSLPTGVSAVSGNSFTTQTGTGLTAPNNSDGDYVAGRGVGGGSSTAGGNGLIVIYVNGVKTSYSYTGDVQTLTV